VARHLKKTQRFALLRVASVRVAGLAGGEFASSAGLRADGEFASGAGGVKEMSRE